MFTAYQPIGIFDSGPGGLALVKYLLEQLPSENLIYFGDTARQPYGIQFQEQVRDYSVEVCTYLRKAGAKIILIGCNTASIAGLSAAQKANPSVPILGMIKAGVTRVLAQPGDKKIGVWGTELTVQSHAYGLGISKGGCNDEVKEIACPALLRLAEKGQIEDKDLIIKLCQQYFQPLRSFGATDLILGCTDLTCVRSEIEEVASLATRIIDPAEEIIIEAQQNLKAHRLLNNQKSQNRYYHFNITGDDPKGFKSFAHRFLGLDIGTVNIVKLQEEADL